MKRPVAKGDVDALRKQGIEVYDSYIMPGSQRMTVLVELEVMPDFAVEEKFIFLIKNKRGFPLLIEEFETEKRGDHNILRFEITAGTTDQVPFLQHNVWTSFVDLCWLLGNEKMDRPAKIEQIDFPLAEGFEPGDLGWHLPSRFMDPLIQALGVLNDVMFQGALKDAVLYGVQVR